MGRPTRSDSSDSLHRAPGRRRLGPEGAFMSEHKAGQVGVIAGGLLAAGLLIAAGLVYLSLTRNGRLDFGPGAIGLGICLTPVAVGFGAWFGSFVLRLLVRLVKS